jgi:hypothetical protein
VRREAEIAIAPLTINSQREQVRGERVGELVRREAEIAIAPLTINSQREQHHSPPTQKEQMRGENVDDVYG